MKCRSIFKVVLTSLVAIFLIHSAFAEEPPIMDVGEIDIADSAELYKKPGYSPYAGRNFPTRVFWGDTHVHTGWSVDAGQSAGNGTQGSWSPGTGSNRWCSQSFRAASRRSRSDATKFHQIRRSPTGSPPRTMACPDPAIRWVGPCSRQHFQWP